MSSLFDDIAQFDEGFLANRREAAAVAHKRVHDRVGSYLKIAKSREEYDARLDFVSDDIRQIVADVAEEFSVDHEKLADAIDEVLKGEGVTDLNEELADAPSAVGEKTSSEKQDCPSCNGSGENKGGSCTTCHGTGQVESTSKASAGHKDGCTCGFCKNKGNLPGRVDQKEQEDKDASEPHDDDDTGVVDKESKTAAPLDDSGQYYPEPDQPTNTFPCKDCGTTLERYRGQGDITCPNCGAEHNSFGQRLAPRSQWGEETGESYGDIMNPRDPEGLGYPYEASKQADVENPSYYWGDDEADAGPVGAEAYPAPEGSTCQNCGGSVKHLANDYPCPHCGEPTFQVHPELQQGLDALINPVAATKKAEAPRDGGGATKRVDLPTGKGDAVGYGASPEIDKKTWKPNALNVDGNLPAVPEGSEMDGSPNPTKQQDLVDDKPDYEGDFLRDTDAVVTQQDLPSADETGHSTERNISQEGQSGTWSEAENDAVTPKVFASADPDVNPLKAILESGFTPDQQVELAIQEYQSE